MPVEVKCPKRARVFPPETTLPCGPDVSCVLEGDDHYEHLGETGLKVGGKPQTITWFDDDRRTFTGEFRPCHLLDESSGPKPCVLPGGHRGRCAP